MSDRSATAVACANIAFIKYWGNRDDALRIPANGSLSMNLDGLYSQTRVTFSAGQEQDSLILNGVAAAGPALQRVSRFLEIVRQMGGVNLPAQVVSRNNFPTGAGIASSAAAFAALSLAASQAIGLDLDEKQLSRLARRGSGSASRSVPGGFVEWLAGSSDEDSYAVSIAPPTHWDLRDCIAIVAAGHKPWAPPKAMPWPAAARCKRRGWPIRPAVWNAAVRPSPGAILPGWQNSWSWIATCCTL